MVFATRQYRAHSTRELAGRLGIAVRTVRNYLTELSASGRMPIIQEKKRWCLAPDAKIETPPVRFMLEEAAAVYLAARLLSRHSDEPTRRSAPASASWPASCPRTSAPSCRSSRRGTSGTGRRCTGVGRGRLGGRGRRGLAEGWCALTGGWFEGAAVGDGIASSGRRRRPSSQ